MEEKWGTGGNESTEAEEEGKTKVITVYWYSCHNQ